MDIKDYASNSHRSKEAAAEETVERTHSADGKIKIREESAGKKVLKTFIAEDFADIRYSIVYDYIIPGIKECIRSMVDMALGFGVDSRRRDSSTRSRNSYDSYYNSSRRSSRDSERRRDEREQRRRLSYDDFLYTTRSKAEQVRKDLFDHFDRYEVLSVQNFYDILRENDMYVDDRDRAYTDAAYGWYDLGPCRVEPVRGGYILNLPKPVPLD